MWQGGYNSESGIWGILNESCIPFVRDGFVAQAGSHIGVHVSIFRGTCVVNDLAGSNVLAFSFRFRTD